MWVKKFTGQCLTFEKKDAFPVGVTINCTGTHDNMDKHTTAKCRLNKNQEMKLTLLINH